MKRNCMAVGKHVELEASQHFLGYSDGICDSSEANIFITYVLN